MTGNMTPRHTALLALVTVVAALAGVVGFDVAPAGRPDPQRPSPPAGCVGCVAPAPPTSPPTISTTAAAPAPGLPAPPPLGWSTCGTDRQCSTLVVPLDYTAPGGPHIGVALERRPATEPAHRLGSLVVNPGGPGESGIGNFDKDLSILPTGVLADFDVVTFDPRGIGASEGIRCTGDTFAGPEPDPVPRTPPEEQPLLAADRAYAASCATGAGPLLAHVGTVDVARDLEELRMALGDPQLTYLGLSYGTLLGLTYAGMFPTHVRAMVLDGPLDPSLSTADLAAAQARGFEGSLDAFIAWCTGAPGACAWHPGGDPHAAFRALADLLHDHPLPVGDQSVGLNEFYTGTFGALYSAGFWPSLGRALAGVEAGDGSQMLGLYRGYERVGDASFNGDANNAVTCLDHPVPADPSAYFRLADDAAAAAPDFGRLFAWGALSCAVWPVPPGALRRPAPVRAPGAPPILVVGTTRDPATPYAWAKSVAATLAHGVLLTRDAVDHVALFYSTCVRSWDETYLTRLDVPPAGTTCA